MPGSKADFISTLCTRNAADYTAENPRRALLGLVQAAGPMPWLYVFELVQNAIDAGADRVRISLRDDRLVLEHNGSEPLREEHVEALCSANRSTKGVDCIGFMGLGFKTVFQRFLTATVAGFGWTFRFDVPVERGAYDAEIRDWIGTVLPSWDETLEAPYPPWTTRFEFSGVQGSWDEVADDVSKLATIDDPTSLAVLALRGLRELQVGDVTWSASYDAGDRTVRLTDGRTVHAWLALERRYKPTHEALRRLAQIRELREVGSERDIERSVIGLIPMDSNGLPSPPMLGRLYATLPTEEEIPFGLHVQADWLVNVSRQALRAVQHDAWQEQIVAQIPSLIAMYLEWLSANPQRQVPEAYNLLKRLPTTSAHQVDAILIGEPFLQDLRQAIGSMTFVPVHGSSENAFATPIQARTIPAKFASEFLTQPAWNASSLFGKPIVNVARFGRSAYGFCQQQGWLRAIAPEDLDWPRSLKTWWNALDERVRIAPLLALWSAGAQHETWTELPMCPTESGDWISARDLAWVSDPLPTDDEPGGPAVREFLAPYTPTADQTLLRSVRYRLPRNEPALRAWTSGAEAWLAQREVRMPLRVLLDKAYAPDARERIDRAAVVALATFAAHRKRKEWVLLVWTDAGAVEPENALLADPFVPGGEARRRVFAEYPAVSPDYVGIDIAFLESLPFHGSIRPIQQAQRLGGRVEAAARLGCEVNDVSYSSRGYVLHDYSWPSQVLRASARDLAALITAQYAQLAHLGRMRVEGFYYQPSTTRGSTLCSWAQYLEQAEWVPCQDDTFRRPALVLPAQDLAYDDAPVATLPLEVTRALEKEGVHFGTALLRSPAMRRLELHSAQLGDEDLADLLNECLDAATDGDGAEQLRRALLAVRIRKQYSLDRLVRRAGSGGQTRSALQGWVLPLTDLCEPLRDVLQTLPLEIPETTTGLQALAYLRAVWRGDAASPDACAFAYDYVFTDPDSNAALRAIVHDGRIGIRLFDGKVWLTPDQAELMVDDLTDARLRQLLPPAYAYLPARYLGSTLETVRSVATILGIPCASEAFRRVLRVSGRTTPRWAPYLQALIDAIASRNVTNEPVIVAPCEALQISLAGQTREAHALCDGGRLYLAGHPAAFAGEAAVELLNVLSLSTNGEICARLGVALFVLDDATKFVEEATQIAALLNVAFVPPAVGSGEMQETAEQDADISEDAEDSGNSADGQPQRARNAAGGGIDPDNAANGAQRQRDPAKSRHTPDDTSKQVPRSAQGLASASGEHRRSSTVGADNFGILVKHDSGEFNLDPWVQPADNADVSERDQIDLTQRDAVVVYERSHGRTPTVKEFSQWGYDIESVDRQGRIRRIEVKGMMGGWRDRASVVLSRRQAHDALSNGNILVSYWLYVVDDLGDRCEVFPVPWSAQGLKFGFYASHWRPLAEKMRALDDQAADSGLPDANE